MVPDNVPRYGTDCKSDDGCLGQGHCEATDIFYIKKWDNMKKPDFLV